MILQKQLQAFCLLLYCDQDPLNKAVNKMKALKSKEAPEKNQGAKLKRKFDEPLPDETTGKSSTSLNRK